MKRIESVKLRLLCSFPFTAAQTAALDDIKDQSWLFFF